MAPVVAKVQQPSRLKRLFWWFCPVQSTVVVQATDKLLVAESFPSPRLSNVGHGAYVFFWIGCVVSYSIFVTYQFFMMPDMEGFMHEPAKDQPMPSINVNAWCSRLGQCGDITVTADYTDAPSWCHSHPPFSITMNAFNESAQTANFTLPLCYTGESVYTTYTDDPMPSKIGLIVDFRDINVHPDDPRTAPPSGAPPATPAPYPYPPAAAARRDFEAQDHHLASSMSNGVVRITGPGGMSKTVNLDAWQVKTVVMGQSVTYDDKVHQSSEVLPLAVQYEGRRNSFRATAIISLAEYADVTRIETKRADTSIKGIMTLLGVFCGMTFMMNSLQIFLEPMFIFLFPGPAEIARRKAEAEKKKQGGSVTNHELEEELIAKPGKTVEGMAFASDGSPHRGDDDDDAVAMAEELRNVHTTTRMANPPPEKQAAPLPPATTEPTKANADEPAASGTSSTDSTAPASQGGAAEVTGRESARSGSGSGDAEHL